MSRTAAGSAFLWRTGEPSIFAGSRSAIASLKATQAVEAGRAQGKAVGTIPGLGNSSRYSPMIEGRVVGLASSEKRRRMTKADI